MVNPTLNYISYLIDVFFFEDFTEKSEVEGCLKSFRSRDRFGEFNSQPQFRIPIKICGEAHNFSPEGALRYLTKKVPQNLGDRFMNSGVMHTFYKVKATIDKEYNNFIGLEANV